MPSEKPYKVLFLCTGNSARSILGEAILNRLGRGRFEAWSAGSRPTGQVNPWAIELLESLDYPTEALRSKSWDEPSRPGAPELDFIFTVCDNAAGESCPLWPGHPMTVHWGIPDPAAVEGTDEQKRRAFAAAYGSLHRCISRLVNLPIESLDQATLRSRLAEIGPTGTDSAQTTASTHQPNDQAEDTP